MLLNKQLMEEVAKSIEMRGLLEFAAHPEWERRIIDGVKKVLENPDLIVNITCDSLPLQIAAIQMIKGALSNVIDWPKYRSSLPQFIELINGSAVSIAYHKPTAADLGVSDVRPT